MSSRIPPLLEPYLALPPEASLILLTSVLGASSNWLVLRFLHGALIGPDALPENDTKVLFVSFMRDFAFWKENAKRLGLDLEKLAAKKRFQFVDGLSGLFLPKQLRAAPGRVGEKILSEPSLASVSRELHNAAQALRNSEGAGKTLLVVDQLDLLLAAGGDQIGSVNLGDMLMSLREEVHATVLTLSADYPVVSAHETPLEKDHAAFLLNTAHQADFIMSLRLLDTGTARDVSGVVRITAGDEAEVDDRDTQRRIEEKELLYFVAGDGAVNVFERGQ